MALASGRGGSSSTKRHWLLRVKAHWEPMSTQIAKRLEDGEPIVSAMLMESHYTLKIRKLSYLNVRIITGNGVNNCNGREAGYPREKHLGNHGNGPGRSYWGYEQVWGMEKEQTERRRRIKGTFMARI